MSLLVTALRFLREHAGIHHATDFEPYDSLDSLTQTKWLEEAIHALEQSGGYKLAPKFNRQHETLVCLTGVAEPNATR
jgi:hypothetical protein